MGVEQMDRERTISRRSVGSYVESGGSGDNEDQGAKGGMSNNMTYHGNVGSGSKDVEDE